MDTHDGAAPVLRRVLQVSALSVCVGASVAVATVLILGSEIGDPLRCSIVGRDGWTVEMPDSVDTLGEVRAQVRRETNDCAHVRVDSPEDVPVSDDTRVLVDHPRLWVSRMGAVSVVVAER